MITRSAVYQVLEAMAPLYTAAALGYASVRWLKAFSDEQCAGINRFVALYAIPVLIFRMVSTNNLYAMNGRLVAADTLQKVVILLGLTAWALWANSRRRDGISSPLQWVITAFSVATMPNAIIMGVPLLNAMYGAVSTTLMKQIVVLQFCFWYNVVIFLYEYMEAMHAATVENGSSAKISPASPEKSAKGDDLIVTPELSDQVVMTIEITDDAVTSTAQDGVVVETKTTSTSGDVKAPSMKHVLWMAVKKILRIPNTYASILGLIWSLIAFKYGLNMPKIIDDSLFTIYTTAVGLSMFSSGTFIARQSRFVPCGYTIASMSMVLKFLIGPVVTMLLASLIVGMRGTLLRVAVVQAALPLAVTSFVYAEEYKVHADIMSTGVIFGIFISLPVTIVYYNLMGL